MQSPPEMAKYYVAFVFDFLIDGISAVIALTPQASNKDLKSKQL